MQWIALRKLRDVSCLSEDYLLSANHVLSPVQALFILTKPRKDEPEQPNIKYIVNLQKSDLLAYLFFPLFIGFIEVTKLYRFRYAIPQHIISTPYCVSTTTVRCPSFTMYPPTLCSTSPTSMSQCLLSFQHTMLSRSVHYFLIQRMGN